MGSSFQLADYLPGDFTPACTETKISTTANEVSNRTRKLLTMQLMKTAGKCGLKLDVRKNHVDEMRNKQSDQSKS